MFCKDKGGFSVLLFILLIMIKLCRCIICTTAKIVNANMSLSDNLPKGVAMLITDFVKDTDEKGRACVREIGTMFLYTPGDRCGHEITSRGRIKAPRYSCDQRTAEQARTHWVEIAKEACRFYGIA